MEADTILEQLKYPIGKYQKPQFTNADMQSEWLKDLQALPSLVEASIEGLNEKQLQTPYREGGWTVQQLIHHIADSHLNAYIRLKLSLTEDNPTIKPYDEKAWAELPDSFIVQVSTSVALLHSVHTRMSAVLANIGTGGWERTYFHPDHQRKFPVWEMVALYSWHGKHHTAHITNLRERMRW